MLKTIQHYIFSVIDYIFPRRGNLMLVEKLSEKEILDLPRAPAVHNCDWIHPLFHYKDPRVRAIIWELKYRGNTLPLEHIGVLLYDEILSCMSDIILFDSKAEFLLIPIPLSNAKRIERGYNQSEYIAKAILEHDTQHRLLYAPQWFEKIKDTLPQSHSQSKQERMQNLINCFQADPRVAGKYIILIDDVVTTGSTLSEARTTLLTASAKDVLAFTIAH